MKRSVVLAHMRREELEAEEAHLMRGGPRGELGAGEVPDFDRGLVAQDRVPHRDGEQVAEELHRRGLKARKTCLRRKGNLDGPHACAFLACSLRCARCCARCCASAPASTPARASTASQAEATQVSKCAHRGRAECCRGMTFHLTDQEQRAEQLDEIVNYQTEEGLVARQQGDYRAHRCPLKARQSARIH